MGNLLEARDHVPDPPCIGCEYWQACATERRACRAFFYYAVSKSGRPITRLECDLPTREQYDHVFCADDDVQSVGWHRLTLRTSGRKRGRPKISAPTHPAILNETA